MKASLNLLKNKKCLFTKFLILSWIIIFMTDLLFSPKFGNIGEWFKAVFFNNQGSFSDALSFVFDKFKSGDFWRLSAYAFTHHGLLHLLVNTKMLLSFVPKLEEKIGSFYLCLIWLAGTMLAGSVVLTAFESSYSKGSSPGLFAFAGFLLIILYIKKIKLSDFLNISERNYFVAYLLLGNFFSIETFLLHFAGFVTGAAIGFLFSKTKKINHLSVLRKEF